jgi:hypothetical protein
VSCAGCSHGGAVLPGLVGVGSGQPRDVAGARRRRSDEFRQTEEVDERTPNEPLNLTPGPGRGRFD